MYNFSDYGIAPILMSSQFTPDLFLCLIHIDRLIGWLAINITFFNVYPSETSGDSDDNTINTNDDNGNENDNDVQVAEEIPTIAQSEMRIKFDIIHTKLVTSGRKKYTV